MDIPKNLLARVNPGLRGYIETKVFPQYEQNDWGHRLDHINYVIRRSLNFATLVPGINYDIVYAVAAYHDLGHHIDAERHEQISAQLFQKDVVMESFFFDSERQLIVEAIEDHRSHLDHPPRSVYGKIVASADCNINVDVMLHRTFTYRIRNFHELTLDDIIEESRQHLIAKYGEAGYARKKMYFDDAEFDATLADLRKLTADKDAFLQRYLKVNKLEHSYELETELSSYLRAVNPELRTYVESEIFPQYDKNDRGHGILHVREVVRRAFRLNYSFGLSLNSNIIYATVAYHDLGKHIDSDHHELASAKLFREDTTMPKFFNADELRTISEAIEDHRSSKSDLPRSVYGKLISSADRNTRIEMVFIRSFFVGKDRQPDTTVAEFLDSNYHRLVKRYSEEDPENMFFADQEYQNFLVDIRKLLRNEATFNDEYCRVNQITSRSHTLAEEPGVEIVPTILI